MYMSVIPARAGIQVVNMFLRRKRVASIPALAGMTLLAVGMSACGPDSQLKRANKLEKKGKYYQAWQKFQEFAAEHPKHPGAPEALFHAGWLAQKQLRDCNMAVVFYDSVLEKYPQSDPWSLLAANQKNNCPDYFPLFPGAEWVEGDSETKGKNARIEVVCKPAPEQGTMPSESGILQKTYFAGDSKFRTTSLTYKKTASEVQEFSEENDLRPKIIMMLPVTADTKWKTRASQRLFSYEVTSLNATVVVGAGEFTNCLVLKSSVEAVPGATLEYYAPGVGRILNTFVTPQGEKRNIELLSYKAGPDVDFRSMKAK